ASLSLPGSPFNPRRGSRGSHQFTLRNGRTRFIGAPPGGDRKPLVLSTYLDAQHLPYADDSNAVTPMSEENGAIVVPMYYANLGSRHSSYTSHASRISYTSHADLLSGPRPPTKESRLRSRSSRNSTSTVTHQPFPDKHYRDFDTSVDLEDGMSKSKHQDNPFIDQPTQQQTVVDMKDVMVLNDIIEQAAGRHSRASGEHGENELSLLNSNLKKKAQNTKNLTEQTRHIKKDRDIIFDLILTFAAAFSVCRFPFCVKVKAIFAVEFTKGLPPSLFYCCKRRVTNNKIKLNFCENFLSVLLVTLFLCICSETGKCGVCGVKGSNLCEEIEKQLAQSMILSMIPY
ncbi:hypothetical protein J6590_056515, partial [Homalodisca vitripennis]